MLLVDSVDSSACSDGTVSILHMKVSRFISKFITKQNENWLMKNNNGITF